MEILELLFFGADGCGCLLEILALFANTGAATSGRSYVRKRRQVKEAGGDPSQVRPLLFVALTFVGVALTVLVAWKWGHLLVR